jgi:hypothetical protein
MIAAKASRELHLSESMAGKPSNISQNASSKGDLYDMISTRVMVTSDFMEN